jgi:hypothetical protein
MKKICSLIIVFIIAISSTVYAQTAVHAVGRGSSMYHGPSKTFNASNQYTVLKLWNQKDPITQEETDDLAYLKKHLNDKKIEIIEYEWKTEEDLKSFMSKYNFSVLMEKNNSIRFSSENSNLVTTSNKAVFVLENNKPISLCSGNNCEKNLKSYFKLSSFN